MVNHIEIKNLLLHLNSRGVELWVENGRLRTRAPEGSITPDLRNQIRLHLDTIVAVLEIAEENKKRVSEIVPIPRIAAAEDYAVSNAQRRLWVLDQMEEDMRAYNMPGALRLKGALDVGALEQAFSLLFNRHEALRTRIIRHEGEARQVIDAFNGFTLEVKDATGLSTGEIETHTMAHATRLFDLEGEALLKVQLLRLKAAEHLLLLNMHHVISDGWSVEILLKELSVLYRALSEKKSVSQALEQLPKLAIQYKDYALWQNSLLEDEATISNLRNYWQQNLKNLTPLDFPVDMPRPTVKTYNGNSIPHINFLKQFQTD